MIVKTLILSVLLSAAFASFVSAGSLVRFRTVLGDTIVELYDIEKPITTSNFLAYVRSDRYTNMFSHRLISDFVIQGGGFRVSHRGTSSNSVESVPSLPNITNEFSKGPLYRNLYGTLSMAKLGGDPNSASSQWFLSFGDNSANLDTQNGGFTVFGRVVSDTNVFNRLNTFTTSRRATNVIVNAQGAFSELPQITYPIDQAQSLTTEQLFANLLYIDISELPPITLPLPNPRSASLTFGTVPGLTQRLEASSFPMGPWQVLSDLMGTGGSLTVPDPAGIGANRFYRLLLPPSLPRPL